ncbi:MAG: DUF481 domain-containing protein [Gammaproteobacteria bacterium]
MNSSRFSIRQVRKRNLTSVVEFLWFIGFIFSSQLSFAQDADDDVVVFRNGDRLTGEVKLLERGRLSFDTDATGVIGIEWEDVAYLSSDQRFEMEDQDGQLYLGSVVNAEEPGQLRIVTTGEVIDIPMLQVVLITPIEQTLIEQFDIDVDMGYSFTKASDLTRTNVGVDVEYRRERNGLRLTFDTVMTDEVDDSTKRENLNFTYQRFLDDRWIALALLSMERNDQLGVDLRTIVGGGRGRYLRQTNSSLLAVYGGVVGTREEINGTINTEDSVEGVAVVRADWFRFDEPELDISTQFAVFPSLSESGRVRSALDLSLRWEVVSDLFWGVTIYHNYDSDPRSIEADTSDYGVITSLGWSF